jgi:hypothetical protein
MHSASLSRGLIIALAILPEVGPLTGQAVSSVVREERSVTVGTVTEIWRLEWQDPPTLVCLPDSATPEWYTCPCIGFQFAESGHLDLVRHRPGAPDERFALTPLFADRETPGAPLAVLRRWPVLREDTLFDDPGLGPRVRSRAPDTAMVFVDYDRDGRATEFHLRVGTYPCGHMESVVVGVSLRSPLLHVFTSVEHPERPLALEEPVWEVLRRSTSGVADGGTQLR